MERAARKAAPRLRRDFGEVEHLQVSRKGPADFVSMADKRAEQTLVEELQKARPDWGFLLEEGGVIEGDPMKPRWIIDPLDGTTNFLHGIPHFAVSIAFRHKNRLEAALVYDPIRQEMFVASRGESAQVNDRRIRVSNVIPMENALLGTGFPFRHPQHQPAYLSIFNALMGRCLEIRRAGAASLDLAYVAAGRLDGYWEIGLKPWDMAGGALLVLEAGGLVGDFAGGNDFLQSGNVVAGNPKAFKALLQEMQPHLTPALAR